MEGQVQVGKPPRLKHLRLAALEEPSSDSRESGDSQIRANLAI